jgi:hypothetical protein
MYIIERTNLTRGIGLGIAVDNRELLIGLIFFDIIIGWK